MDALFNLGQVALELGDPEAAERRYREAHGIALRQESRMGSAYQVLGMGQVAAARSDNHRAARLLAAAEVALEDFGAAWAEGRATALEDALALAFGG
jgi:hypothetical protein